MPDVPAPAEPALGEPAALPLLPDEDPPPLCANAAAGDTKSANARIAELILMKNLLCEINDSALPLFLSGTISTANHCITIRAIAGVDRACAN
jgi:hypothetical protein